MFKKNEFTVALTILENERVSVEVHMWYANVCILCTQDELERNTVLCLSGSYLSWISQPYLDLVLKGIVQSKTCYGHRYIV